MATKILIADNQVMMRQGLEALFSKEPDIDIVGQVTNSSEAIEVIDELEPDVIVMSVEMPDVGGITATKDITAKYPDVKVIALSTYDSKQFVVAMLKAGASGYVLKQMPFLELTNAIHAAQKGKSYLSGDLTDIVIDEYKDNLVSRNKDRKRKELNPRETQILSMLASGLSSKETAVELGKSPKTVDAYRRQIMRKTKNDNMADLIKFAIRTGLTSLK